MIAAYINKETKQEVRVTNFTAILVKEQGRKTKDKMVLYCEKDNSTTFVIDKATFDKEYVLKNNN